MCAYNKVNGTYASEHHWLLTEVLRDEWGFDGVVVSDWGAVHDRVAALAAGLDLEMPPESRGQRSGVIVAASGPASSTRRCSTTAVRRMLRLVERAQPALAEPADRRRRRPSRRWPAGRPRSRRVLLKNDGGVAAAAPGAGQHGRRDRGVRPDAALSRAPAAPR